ncbi:MAG: DUF4166 domain-containing protein [Curvibacter sp.]|nr:DUF4166 domain-containing protein [Curvibacter sp.]
MKSPMQQALGADWDRLAPVLQAHHRGGTAVETGWLDVEFPTGLLPLVRAMGWLGALVHRRGRQIDTRVEKQVRDGRQHWRRTLRYVDGQSIRFDSSWVPTADGHLIEYVNPFLGLELAPCVVAARLELRGLRFVLRLGPWLCPIPQWLAFGVTSIVEEALDEGRFAMDFRMTHPWFGLLFRYAGVFEVEAPCPACPVHNPPSPPPGAAPTKG